MASDRPRLDAWLAELRNPAKRAYAARYRRWLENGSRGHWPAPAGDLTWTAAQAVRMNLDGFWATESVTLPNPRQDISPGAKQKKIHPEKPG